MRGAVTSNLQLQFYRHRENVSCWQQMTVFCDFDGPLVDVSNRYYSTYQLGLDDIQVFYKAKGITLPLQVLSKEQFWQMKQERVGDIEIAMRSGLQGEQINLFLQRVVTIVNQPALLYKDRMQPQVNWALALLHSKGVRLIVVTLRPQTQAIQILRNYGLERLFSGIYGTEDDRAAYINYAEVKTQLLAKAIAQQPQHNCQQEPAWMVGDTEADILAGQALKIPTIAVTCGIRSSFYLKQFQPTCIATDLLSAAYYLLGIRPVTNHLN